LLQKVFDQAKQEMEPLNHLELAVAELQCQPEAANSKK
jgi:hypothetical protein